MTNDLIRSWLVKKLTIILGEDNLPKNIEEIVAFMEEELKNNPSYFSINGTDSFKELFKLFLENNILYNE